MKTHDQRVWQQATKNVKPLRSRDARLSHLQCHRDTVHRTAVEGFAVAPTAPTQRSATMFARIVDELSFARPLGSSFILRYRAPRATKKDIAVMRKAASSGVQQFQHLSVDLHGMSLAQAKVAFCDALCEIQTRNLYYLHLIHGKGEGVLKGHICHWVQQIPCVVVAYSLVELYTQQSGALLAQIAY